ncbi:MAG: DUF4262 domain-containing protein [Actinobacteria bacterium]|nr:DUF4262 domain-containing protein [Actinomycetota bacterium]
MCDLCDGASLDEARFKFLWMIERFGWALQYVEGPTSVEDSWCYSIGLAEKFSHPELIVSGVGMGEAAGVLNALGDMVRWGTRLEAGDAKRLPSGEYAYLSPVHPVHFDRGVFATWVDLYEAMGKDPERAALEVILPGQDRLLLEPNSPIGEPPVDR